MTWTTTIAALARAGIIVLITSKGKDCSQQEQKDNYFVFPLHK